MFKIFIIFTICLEGQISVTIQFCPCSSSTSTSSSSPPHFQPHSQPQAAQVEDEGATFGDLSDLAKNLPF